MKLILALASLALLVSGCTWSEPADVGQDVVLDIHFDSEQGDYSVRRTVTVGVGSGLGDAINTALPGARAGTQVSAPAGVYVRNATFGPYVAERTVDTAVLEGVLGRSPTVGDVLTDSRSSHPFVVRELRGSQTVLRIDADDGDRLPVPQFAAEVVFHVSAASYWTSLDIPAGTPVGNDLMGIVHLPVGTFVSLGTHDGRLVLGRVDPSPPASCPPPGAAALVVAANLQEPASPADTSQAERTATVTVEPCHFPGPVSWTWSAPGETIDLDARGGTVIFPVPREDAGQASVSLSVTASSGDVSVTRSIVVELLKAEESNHAATMTATVLRVQASPEAVPEDGNWAGGPSQVVLGERLATGPLVATHDTH